MQHLFDFTQELKIPQINGLQYIPNFISEQEEVDLMAYVDSADWDNSLKRRVQHYGYAYDYTSRRVESNAYLGALPPYLAQISKRLFEQNLFPKTPNQCIVNEYLPGQGISDHIDCVPCFKETIASLSLGSGTLMQFKHQDLKEEIYLKPRSLLLLSKDARYKWSHGIPARKSDNVNGIKLPRDRRVSLTFRTVITS